MTNGTNTKTLKEQLESETAATELSAAEDSERYRGGAWWQLSDEEESVFDIDPGAVPAHDDGLVMLRGFQEYCLQQPVMGGRPYRAGLPATSRLVRRRHKLARLTIAAEPVQASLPKLGHGVAPFDNLSQIKSKIELAPR
jgi:hypothetical protein